MPLTKDQSDRAMEVVTEFLELTLETGPCPIRFDDGFWFKRLCALGERIAVLETKASEDEKKTALLAHCQKFITEQRISCGETVYQSDRVIENAYDFMHGVCKIVGFMDDEEEDDDD